MRVLRVAAASTALNDFPRVLQVQELLLVEVLLLERPVGAGYEAVLARPPRLDEVEDDLRLLRLGLDDRVQRLGPVVPDDPVTEPLDLRHLVENGLQSRPRKRGRNLDRRRLPPGQIQSSLTSFWTLDPKSLNWSRIKPWI